MTDGHVFGIHVADLHTTNEAASRSHAQAHRRLVALLLDGASFQIQNPAGVLWLLRRELLANLFDVLWVDHFEERRSVPVVLRVIQNGRDRVRHVDDPSSVT